MRRREPKSTRVRRGTLLLVPGVLVLMTLPPIVGERIVHAQDAQEGRGKDAFGHYCAACHGTTLAGVGEAPPLVGTRFIADFDGLTVGALFDRIRTTMPLNAPSSLGRDQYADILAFILQVNGFPAGPNELYRRSEYLDAIRFESSREEGGCRKSASC
jgi:mono/diheme cytochrome c family protein